MVKECTRICHLVALSLLISICAVSSAPLSAVHRVALVIGNSEYTQLTKLPNPVNDAKSVAAKLWSAGFEVIEVIDADYQQMRSALATFRGRIREGGHAVFYYAGHGVSIDGTNFLLPVTINASSRDKILDEALSANLIPQMVEAEDAQLVIMILDACRDNPFLSQDQTSPTSDGPDIAVTSSESRGIRGGLSEIEPGSIETVIAYATAPGKVALDGEADHSPYTEALLGQLDVTGLEIDRLFRNVRSEVRKKTREIQIPWVASTLENNHYIRFPDEQDLDLDLQEKGPADTLGLIPPEMIVKLSLLESILQSNDLEGYNIFLQRFPDDTLSDLVRTRLETLTSGSMLTPAPVGHIIGETPKSALSHPTLSFETAIGVGAIAVDPTNLISDWVDIDSISVIEVPRRGKLFVTDSVGTVRNVTVGSELMSETVSTLTYEPEIGQSDAPEKLVYQSNISDGLRRQGEFQFVPFFHACDVLAALHHDPTRVTKGVRNLLIDLPAARVACRQAVQDYPQVKRFLSQLARVYRLNDQFVLGLATAQRAANSGHPAGMAIYGDFLRHGWGAEASLEKALYWLKRAAALGDVLAYVYLGEIFRDGNGVPADLEQARRWFEKAGDKDFDWGITNLGLLYYDGVGVEQDLKEARRLFLKAALLGDPVAQEMLGLMHRDGIGVEQNFNVAVNWFESAAGQGYPYGEAELGRFYEMGWGVEQNSQRALLLYQRAADEGDATAFFYLGEAYQNGVLVDTEIEQSIVNFEKAVSLGNRQAARRLGDLYREGEAISADPSSAAYWYEKGAALGDGGAAFILGSMAEQGANGSIDERAALRWYKTAYELGKPSAARAAAKLLVDGAGGLLPTPIFAKLWYERAASGGDTYAMRDLAQLILDKGDALGTTEQDALDWLEEAANHSHAGAALDAGRLLEEGRGDVTSDPVRALLRYQQAASLGSSSGARAAAKLLESGNGVQKDQSAAFRLYMEAANAGDVWAARDAAKMLEAGRGTAANPLGAHELYIQSAKGGNLWSALEVARIYHDGQYLEEALDLSAAWYAIASASEDPNLIRRVDTKLDAMSKDTKEKALLILENWIDLDKHSALPTIELQNLDDKLHSLARLVVDGWQDQ